jgi:chromate transporter
MTLELAFRLCLVFGSASLLSFGGGNAIVPQLQLRTVDTYGWLTAAQFADSFAIAQAAPGPSTLLVSLLGYDAAGLAGALLATAAMIVPAGLLIYLVARLWQGAARMRWRTALERGMAPVSIGLVLASGVVVARSADHSWAQYALTVAATVVLSLTRINPLFVVAASGLAAWAAAA